MDIQDIALLFVGLAAIVMAGTGIVLARRPATVSGVLEAAESALTDIETAAGAAREYVLAAEQLWRTGRLDKDGRLAWVLSRLGDAFPQIAEETLTDSIEAAVAWLKMGAGE